MVVSLNRRTLIETPIYNSPYNGDPQKGTSNLGIPPFRVCAGSGGTLVDVDAVRVYGAPTTFVHSFDRTSHKVEPLQFKAPYQDGLLDLKGT